jgi:hypothetical protein
MGDPGLVAILDRWIAELEKYREQQITDLVASHGESSLYMPEDALDDDELRLSSVMLDDLRILRKKVIAGETS